MNTFKTRDGAGSREEFPFRSGFGGKSPSLTTTADLFHHFSTAMKGFQPLTFRRVESWSGPIPDLSFERILRMDGPHSYICVVRTQDHLEKLLADSAAKERISPLPRWFDRLALDMAWILTQQLFEGSEKRGDSIHLKPSSPRYWPLREADAVCRVWVGATPVEVRYWRTGGSLTN